MPIIEVGRGLVNSSVQRPSTKVRLLVKFPYIGPRFSYSSTGHPTYFLQLSQGSPRQGKGPFFSPLFPFFPERTTWTPCIWLSNFLCLLPIYEFGSRAPETRYGSISQGINIVIFILSGAWEILCNFYSHLMVVS